MAGGMLLAFHSGGFVISLQEVGFTAVGAVEKQVSRVTGAVVNFFTSIGKLYHLQKDYDELMAKLQKLEAAQRNNVQLRNEVENLQDQLSYKKSLVEKSFGARIIARTRNTLNPLLTVDKGSVDGVKKNMAVHAYQNGESGLVGRVVSVGLGTALVMPIYSLDAIVSARLDATRDLGLVYGNGRSDEPLVMRYVRKRVGLLEELHYGDLIVTSGENENYSRDVVIGSVGKISVLDYDSSLEIEVKPVIDFSRLENVIIVDVGNLEIEKLGETPTIETAKEGAK